MSCSQVSGFFIFCNFFMISTGVFAVNSVHCVHHWLYDRERIHSWGVSTLRNIVMQLTDVHFQPWFVLRFPSFVFPVCVFWTIAFLIPTNVIALNLHQAFTAWGAWCFVISLCVLCEERCLSWIHWLQNKNTWQELSIGFHTVVVWIWSSADLCL